MSARSTRQGTDRFTLGLVIQVARVLEAHGYGPFAGGRPYVESPRAAQTSYQATQPDESQAQGARLLHAWPPIGPTTVADYMSCYTQLVW